MTNFSRELKTKYNFISDEPTTDEAFALDGESMTNKVEALSEIYHKLGYDEYIPYANYDGLAELLSKDLWPEKNKLIFNIINTDSFLNQSNTEVVEAIFQIFDSMNKENNGDSGDEWISVRLPDTK